MDDDLNSLSGQLGKLSDIEHVADFAESLIDLGITNEIAKDIPFVKWIASAFSVYKTVQDRIFFKKTIQFIRGIEEIPPEEKAAFCQKIDSDKKFRSDLSENIICILNSLNNMHKPIYVGKALSAYIKGLISYEDWVSISNAIDRTDYQDILALENYAKGVKDGRLDLEKYYASGISQLEKSITVQGEDPTRQTRGTIMNRPESTGSLRFRFSPIGKKLFSILKGSLEKEVREERNNDLSGFIF